MKPLYTQLFLFASIIILGSCAGTRDMQVQVMRPALITIPQDIKSIAVLNRSIPTGKAGLEGTLTGETPVQDKELSEECLRGLNETLNTSDRFVSKRVEYTMESSDPKSLSFGLPLDWTTVDSICERLAVDGLLVLEYFDTDFTVDNPVGAATQVIQGVMTGGQTSIEVTGTATAAAGFRVYYAKSHKIAYEDRFSYKKWWRQRANNIAEAIGKLIKRNAALIDVSYETGTEFAMNIIPLYFWEQRDMYKGKKGDMERAERQALSKDWEAARKTWMEVYELSNKQKIRAKAAFNVALANEVLGNLSEAQKWASIAYVDGGKKPMLNYSNIIDVRVREQEKLKEQLGGSESEK